MFRVSVLIVLAMAFLRSLVTGIATTLPGAPPIDGCKVKLYTNDFAPDPSTLLADFTEATFTGYGEATIATWGDTINTGPARAGSTAQATFTAGAIVAPGQTVYGYYVTDAAETVVLFSERFTDPVQFVAQYDSLSLDLVFSLPASLPAVG